MLSTDLKLIIGSAAAVLGILSYYPYYRDIFRGTTKPHVFSWLVWGLLTGIAFFAQLTSGAGSGAWVTGSTAFLCLTIAALALVRGERHITKTDWLCFGGALLGLLLWQLTDNPLLAVLLVTATDALAYIPTFRKSYLRPFEETLSTYIVSTIKFILGLIALNAYTPTTWLYPAALVLMNGAFVLMVIIRRQTLRTASTTV